jgi:uncharacterized protein YjbJ (UPF0337 family)
VKLVITAVPSDTGKINTYYIMNTTEVKGNWNEQKGKLKQKFAILTDNDLMFSEGKKEEMLGRLQKKLGKTKEELHTIIAGL